MAPDMGQARVRSVRSGGASVKRSGVGRKVVPDVAQIVRQEDPLPDDLAGRERDGELLAERREDLLRPTRTALRVEPRPDEEDRWLSVPDDDRGEQRPQVARDGIRAAWPAPLEALRGQKAPRGVADLGGRGFNGTVQDDAVVRRRDGCR